MHEKHEKTNAMRQLDCKKAVYTVHSYDGGALSGTEVASALGSAASRRSSPSAKPAGIMSL